MTDFSISFESFKKRFITVNTLAGVMSGFVAPIMYVTLKVKGFEIYEVALLILISSIVTILLEIPAGVISDKMGRRNVFIFGECLLLIFCISIFMFQSYSLMIAAMIASGISSALISGTLDALYVDRLKEYDSSPDTVQKSIAVVGAFNMLGLFGGALTSSLLILLSTNYLEGNQFEMIYGLVSILIPIHIFITIALIKPDKKESREIASQEFSVYISDSLSKLKGRDTLNLLLISSSASAMAFITIEKLWQIRVHDLIGGEANWVYGCIFAVSMLIGAIGQACSSMICKLVSNNYINAIFLIRSILIVCFIALYFSNSLLQFILVYFFVLFFASASASPVLTLFHNQVEDHERSTMLSYRAVFLQIGASIGIAILSWISFRFSINEAFITSAFILSLSLFVLMKKELRKLGKKLQVKES